jgi:glucokinase
MVEPFVLAIDIGGTKIAIATADCERNILQKVEISTADCVDGKMALHRTIQEANSLIQKTKNMIGGDLISIGMASIGITFPDRVVMAPNIPGWEELKIEETLQNAFPGLPIKIENDVKAAAVAELQRGSLLSTTSGLLVNLGTGLGMAYTVNDQVISGHHGAAGEIGYLLRTKEELYGARENIAPLEEFAGGKALGERASEYFNQPMTTKELFQLAKSNSDSSSFLEEVLRELAYQITNILISWDPQKVAFSGGIMGEKDVVLPYIQDYVDRFMPFPCELTLAEFQQDASLQGAIDLAVLQIENIIDPIFHNSKLI